MKKKNKKQKKTVCHVSREKECAYDTRPSLPEANTWYEQEWYKMKYETKAQ